MKAGQDTDEKERQENLQPLIKLQRAFPGLAVKLQYKVAVRRTARDRAGGLSEFHDANLSAPASDDVSLHSVAMARLFGASRVADFGGVLQESELSLSTIHIMAIGLQGLPTKALAAEGLNLNLTDA